MIILLSPSKSINFKTTPNRLGATVPAFEKEAGQLGALLAGYKTGQIAEMEKVSVRIALSAYEYFQTYSTGLSPRKEALFAYSGNVYDKLDAASLDEKSLQYLQDHLCIFSALYGVLRPSDLIKPYRLDMNSTLVPDLYAFWKQKVTGLISRQLKKNNHLLVNLASQEYFKLLDLKSLPSKTKIITLVFQQEKNGKLTTGSLYAKHARGLMARFIAENEITDPEHLQGFDSEGYMINYRLSGNDTWYFTR